MAKRIEVIRLDKGTLTTQGFLRAPAYLTRVGVFKYRQPDGTIRRELRHPDDVFRPDSLATLQMAPVTSGHPKHMVNAENVRDLAIGWISDSVKPDGQYVKSDVVLSDKNAIAAADKGTVELSCGYEADLVQEEGVYDGEPYDYRQTNIRYNHVAQVERGRAGPTVRLHLDADDAVMVSDDKQSKEDSGMEKILIDGKEYEVSPEVKAALEAHMAKMQGSMDQANAKMADMVPKAEVAQKVADALKDEKAKNDSLSARVDALDAKLKEKKDGLSQEEVIKAVAARKKVDRVATAILGADAKFDDKSDLEVMKEVILKKYPSTKLDGQSEIYIRGRFDAISEDVETSATRADELGNRIAENRKAEDYDLAAARERQRKDAQEAWQKPLAVSKK